MIYLDWAATAPPEAAALRRSLELSSSAYGNPSSPHRPGKAARDLLEEARASLLSSLSAWSKGKTVLHGAAALAPRPHNKDGHLVFTASGTEADHIPLLALLRQQRFGLQTEPGRAAPHLIVSAIEHAAVYEQSALLARLGFAVSYLRPDAEGFVRPQAVAEALRPETKYLAVMAVNNETGAVQDIGAIGNALFAACQERGIRPPLFHVDSVQALGKIPLDIAACGATSAAFSAHKLQGPKGVGALWYSKAVEPLAAGGGQEQGLRPGTENLFGALAFAQCVEKAATELDSRLAHARSLEKAVLEGIGAIPGACAVPRSRRAGDPRWSPWIISCAFPGLSGEVLARALSDAGIAVSTGSACSHLHKTKGRRILEAMGLEPDLAFASIRISFGPETRPDEIERFLSTAADLYRRLKT